MTVSVGIGLGRGDVVRSVVGDPNQFYISIEDLFTAFIRAIKRYEAAVRANKELQDKFDQMFPFYGGIKVQGFTRSGV